MTFNASTTRRQFFGSLGGLGLGFIALSAGRSAAAEGGLAGAAIGGRAGALDRAVRIGPAATGFEDEPPVGSPATIGFPVLPGDDGLIVLNNFGGFSVASGSCSHIGIDVFPTTAETKTLVSCVDGLIEGQRVFAGSQGNAWIVRDADGVSYRYHHIAEFEPGLEVGSEVRRGDVLGTMGSSGNANSPHLHFEVRLDGTSASAIDPIPLFPLPIGGVSVGDATGCS
ncbi:MAG: M23 family metallopeptidase [Ilumatobacter sp.]